MQICGSYPDTIARTVELIERECTVDFIDINMGCPIDVVVNKGAGSSLLTKPMRMKNIARAACGTSDIPLTLKVNSLPTAVSLDHHVRADFITLIIYGPRHLHPMSLDRSEPVTLREEIV